MAGTELSQVVDEDEGDVHPSQERDPQARQAPVRKPKWYQVDADKIFAYKTFKVVRIMDWRLGFLYWTIVTTVIMYIIVVAFNMEGKHAQLDSGIGTVITRFKGKAFTEDGKVYDEADLRFPVIEPSGAFIMTKAVIMKDQRLGRCMDMDSVPRACPCRSGEVCGSEGFCEVQTWCPSLGDRNAHDPGPDAEVVRLAGVENTFLQILSAISFPGVGNFFYVTGASTESGKSIYRNISLGNLLSRADPPVHAVDIMETGAIVGVSFFWDCDVTIDCEPIVVIKRLDGDSGFVQKRSRHVPTAQGDLREAHYIYGVRIVVESAGIGKRVSLSLIVIQIGSGLALLRLASMAADNLMLSRIFEKSRRDAYYKCKVQETADYTDLQDRINLVRERKDQSSTLIGGNRGRPASQLGGGGGAHVALGLGPGGRGGLPSAILRGRSSSSAA